MFLKSKLARERERVKDNDVVQAQGVSKANKGNKQKKQYTRPKGYQISIQNWR